MKTLTLILEYCGGSRTDALFDQMETWNPGRQIDVLDNASPTNLCSRVTQYNRVNSFIGGGIIDAFRIAETRNCDNLFFLVNDIDPITPIVVGQFEAELLRNERLIQVAASVTIGSSPHTNAYPWMVAQPSQQLRRVPHSDLLCCIIPTSFVRSFGGFPMSRGGWGYDWELAYQARVRDRHIAVADWCVVRHIDNSDAVSKRNKHIEMLDIYKSRYPKFELDIRCTIADYWKRGMIKFDG